MSQRRCQDCDLPGKLLCDSCRAIRARMEESQRARSERRVGERSRGRTNGRVTEEELARRMKTVKVRKMPARSRRRVRGNGTRTFYYAQDRWCVVYRKGRGQPLRLYRAGLSYNVARKAETAAKRAGLKFVRKVEGIPAECQGVTA